MIKKYGKEGLKMLIIDSCISLEYPNNDEQAYI